MQKFFDAELRLTHFVEAVDGEVPQDSKKKVQSQAERDKESKEAGEKAKKQREDSLPHLILEQLLLGHS